MAPSRCPARALLLAYASLLAAAVGLGSPEPGAPSESRAREETPPGNELPAGPAARPPVRDRPARPGPGDLGPQPPRQQRAPLGPRAPLGRSALASAAAGSGASRARGDRD